jgi:hypothetical protein
MHCSLCTVPEKVPLKQMLCYVMLLPLFLEVSFYDIWYLEFMVLAKNIFRMIVSEIEGC